MKNLPIFLLLLLIAGCAKQNPVDVLLESKTPDEVFYIFGKPMLLGCLESNDLTGKCRSELTDAVAAARGGGYNDINLDHFSPDVLARFLTALRSSSEAKQSYLSKDINKDLYRY